MGKLSTAEPIRTAGPVCGYWAHGAVRRAGPEVVPVCDDIAQWCFPARRQHAGKLFSPAEAKSGLISARLIRASRTMAEMRRKGLSYLTFGAAWFFPKFEVARYGQTSLLREHVLVRRKPLERLRNPARGEDRSIRFHRDDATYRSQPTRPS